MFYCLIIQSIGLYLAIDDKFIFDNMILNWLNDISTLIREYDYLVAFLATGEHDVITGVLASTRDDNLLRIIL